MGQSNPYPLETIALMELELALETLEPSAACDCFFDIYHTSEPEKNNEIMINL